MRDRNRNIEYFSRIISLLYDSVYKVMGWIENGKTPLDRITFVKRSIVQKYILILQCRYSLGHDLRKSVEDLKFCYDHCYESWDGFWKLRTGEPNGSIILSQYTLSAYDEMLLMLSLGYLLDVPNEDFKKLVDVIDRDGVKDFLFEFIIRDKIKDRQPITEESYKEYFHIPKCFEKLRQAITETDKGKAEKLVKEFITKDWYKNHKGQGWYDSHKSKHDTYFGYWSFETAAVVKIMNLNDSNFIDCQYYPKDLVHQENS
ncbi:DUF1911 domain-containing protein [soil metagenome]